MADVFISYSQKARESAKSLEEKLKAKNYEVWWDDGLTAGERFNDVIRTQLEEAGAVIVIWSAESINSNYVKMEAGIAWAFDKLIPVRVADLPQAEIPSPFQDFHTDDVADVDRIERALGALDVRPKQSRARRRLSREELIKGLALVNASLPASVDAWLIKCREENFRIVVQRSLMIKAAVPGFAEVNFCTLFPDGKFQTNYISELSERVGDPSIAAAYLDGVANLIDGATVRRDGKSWTWRVEVDGQLPEIASVLAKGDEWIALMKAARSRIFTAAANTALQRSGVS